MSSIRVNVSLPEVTYSELKEEVPLRERSKFITLAGIRQGNTRMGRICPHRGTPGRNG